MGTYICLNCNKEIICDHPIRGKRKYCNHKCKGEYWKKNDCNPFKGKKHSEETIKKITSHPNFISRKKSSGMKGKKISDEHKKILRKYAAKLWNVKYRHDVKYKGTDRIKIIDWCRKQKAVPDEIVKKWFLPCQNCGWDKAKCDLHYIIPKKEGGTTELTNLISLCPNCHRLVHHKNLDVTKINNTH